MSAVASWFGIPSTAISTRSDVPALASVTYISFRKYSRENIFRFLLWYNNFKRSKFITARKHYPEGSNSLFSLTKRADFTTMCIFSGWGKIVVRAFRLCVRGDIGLSLSHKNSKIFRELTTTTRTPPHKPRIKKILVAKKIPVKRRLGNLFLLGWVSANALCYVQVQEYGRFVFTCI